MPNPHEWVVDVKLREQAVFAKMAAGRNIQSRRISKTTKRQTNGIAHIHRARVLLRRVANPPTD